MIIRVSVPNLFLDKNTSQYKLSVSYTHLTLPTT